MTDWRALCKELADDLETWASDYLPAYSEILVARARAALAQPEPEAVEQPSDYIDPEHTGNDREMLEVFYTACQGEGGTTDEIHLRGLRAVLARFGNYPVIPDSSTCKDSLQVAPASVAERLPGPGDFDGEGRCWWYLYTPTPEWHLRFGRTGQHNHWLPAQALPIPRENTPTKPEFPPPQIIQDGFL